MLIGLATGLRFRLGLAIAAFAAFCFVAPPAVLAFGHGGNTLDCLAHADKVNHGKPAASQVAHHHGDHAPATGLPGEDGQPGPVVDHQMSCCGLFCLSALAADSGLMQPTRAAAAPDPARDPDLLSRVPERLDRPPISIRIV